MKLPKLCHPVIRQRPIRTRNARETLHCDNMFIGREDAFLDMALHSRAARHPDPIMTESARFTRANARGMEMEVMSCCSGVESGKDGVTGVCLSDR